MSNTSDPIAQCRRIILPDEFFYVEQDNYDQHAELAIPFYREMHEALPSCAPRFGPLRILDLGSGTGRTSLVFLIRPEFSGSTVRAVELFEAMHTHAKARLCSFGNRVKYVTGDFMEVPLGDDYDLCVSALAIHHQDPEGKRFLFRRIFEALRPGGRFLMIDWTKFNSPSLERVSMDSAVRHVELAKVPAEVVKQWVEHWRVKNRPDSVEDLCSWLTEAGFTHAECLIRHFGMALICAEKQ
jgi:tRNA (cmo5U34)-methyltransferase